MATTVAIIFLSLGLFFLLVAAIGMVRLPDVFARAHAVGLTDTMGAFFMLFGLAIYEGFSLNTLKILVVFSLLIFAQPCRDACDDSSGLTGRCQTLDEGTFMNYMANVALLLLLIMTAAGSVLVKDLIGAVLILGSYSFFLALIWAWLGAVDVAFTEAVVGAGLATVFFLLTLFLTVPREKQGQLPRAQWPVFVGLPLLGALLLFVATDLPTFGDPASPPNTHISPVYLENSLKDTETPNVVASVLMDYRSFDTLIETVVIFTSGIAAALLLWRKKS